MKTLALKTTLNKFENNFDKKTILRGESYYLEGRVTILSVSQDRKYISSRVIGALDQIHKIKIKISNNRLTGEQFIDGACSCPVGFNCKHVFASLLKTYNDTNVYEQITTENNTINLTFDIDNKINSWINDFKFFANRIINTSPVIEKGKLIYAVEPLNENKNIIEDINISLYYFYSYEDQDYDEFQIFDISDKIHQSCIKQNDEDILATLQFINRNNLDNEKIYSLKDSKSSLLFTKILSTNRCYFLDPKIELIKLGNNEQLQYEWEQKDKLEQMLNVLVKTAPATLIKLDKLWYYNKIDQSFGLINTALSLETIEFLLKAPKVSPNEVTIVRDYLKKIAPGHAEILPKVIKPIPKIVNNIMPCIELDLYNESPIANIYFDYDGYIVPFSRKNNSETISYIDNNTLFEFKRDFNQEKEYITLLSSYINLELLNTYLSKKDEPDKFKITSLNKEEDYLNLNFHVLPELESTKWRVIRNHENFQEIILDDDIEWYSELDEESEYDYFGFKLGIEIDNKQIDILPVVSDLIKNISVEDIAKLPDDSSVPLRLPNGKILSVPHKRIKPILNILVELYDQKKDCTGTLKLAKYQSQLLNEIEQAFKAAKMRWIGGENLRKFGQRLADFKKIKKVKPPKSFNAELRAYQQEGVNWLQFLREYNMNGILADDMGLGKTVQTLAHLSIEKQKNRLVKPTLIIAPTSLMVNWHSEIYKFAPNLKSLVYHGTSRDVYKEQIIKYDIILTTYPLLLRDKEVWLKNQFYYLILDEAQYIKNHKTKSTQIVHQINAKHRLCLTGTPMENNLHELWSIFHFLMPGMLGNATQFRQLYRTPIEKNQDLIRQQILSRKIKPFLLRRKKSQVADELPEKTVIIKKVDLIGKQRDLYESIRLSMEKKVRKVLQEKGLSRSHIIILDAILKLRQTCCHPKLLNLATASRAYKTSAKTEMLMEMLPSMIEEGRKIIIFSQFTKMLDIITSELQTKKIKFSKLTGATRNRKKAIDMFQNGDASVFLISLKAGGTGLNLTAADTVIHYDPWWNPAAEDQATDRAHRIGQKKSVFVYKLLSSGTIEETIHEMQQKKRKLIEGLLTEKRFSGSNLTKSDLEYFFRPI